MAVNNPFPSENDVFAHSICVIGTSIFVGVPYDDEGAMDSGSVHQFDLSTGTYIRTITNPAPGISDYFGDSVTALGGRLVVGAPNNDAAGTNTGSAYIFDGSSGAHLLTIDNSRPSPDENFGFSLAPYANNVLIGCVNDDAHVSHDGAAYLFDSVTGAELLAIYNPTPNTGDRFGEAVAAHGSDILITAPADDTMGLNTGAVYLYDSSGTLIRTFHNPNPGVGDYFGQSIATLPGKVIVGAPYADAGGVDSGRIYVFDKDAGSLLLTVDDPGSSSDNFFGHSLATFHDRIAVGAPHADAGALDVGIVYVLDSSTGSLLQTLSNPAPAAIDQFGLPVVWGGDRLLVGTYGDDAGAANAGSAYVFEQIALCPTSGPTPTPEPSQTATPSPTANPTGTPVCGVIELVRTVANPAPNGDDQFGVSVAVSDDYLLVGALRDDTGATDAGSAYLFNAATGSLLHTFNNPTPAFNDKFGLSVSLSDNYAVVGANDDDTGSTNAGSAYVFDVISGALLQTINNPTPDGIDQFGYSVSISGDRILISAPTDSSGASNAGIAYLFNASTGSLVWTYDNPAPVYGDAMGYSVSLSGDNALIGVPYNDTGATDAGCAYLFSASTGALLRTFHNPSPDADDGFGLSVSVSGNNALIGSFQDDTGAFNSGSAHLFDAVTGALLHTFHNPTPGDSDLFGKYVAISGNNLLIGAPGDDGGLTDAGSAYLFDAITGSLLQAINNPTPGTGDEFGNPVSINGNALLIGAWRDDTLGGDVGSAYVFACSAALPSPSPLPTTTSTATPTPTSSPTMNVICYQPGPEGKDTCYGTVYIQNGAPDVEVLYVGGWADYYYDYFEFDLSGLPSASATVKAELHFYFVGSAPNDPQLQLHRITESWTEAGVTLLDHPADVHLQSIGPIAQNEWKVLDITALYRDWKNGAYPNYGIVLVPTSNNHANWSMASSDHSNTAIRPKLCVEFSNPPSTSTPTPTPTVSSTATPIPTATPTPTPVPGDLCVDAISVLCGGSVSGDTTGMTFESAPVCGKAGSVDSQGAWYRIVGTGEMMTASTCGSAFDTKLSIFAGDCGSLTCIDGNDDYSCMLGSEVTWPTSPGVDYFVLVHGYQGANGAYTLSISCTSAPSPTANPCCPGDADNSGSFVDANDFIAVQANFGGDNGVGGLGDADCSGSFVDANDFIAVQANFGADCG